MSGLTFRYINLDIDSKERLQEAVRRLESHWIVEWYKVKKSSNKGYHVRVKLRREVTFWEAIWYRYWFLDDYPRIEFDIRRYRCKLYSWIDTIFTLKFEI